MNKITATYYSDEINATLDITTADDATGKATGSITIAGINIPITIH